MTRAHVCIAAAFMTALVCVYASFCIPVSALRPRLVLQAIVISVVDKLVLLRPQVKPYSR